MRTKPTTTPIPKAIQTSTTSVGDGTLRDTLAGAAALLLHPYIVAFLAQNAIGLGVDPGLFCRARVLRRSSLGVCRMCLVGHGIAAGPGAFEGMPNSDLGISFRACAVSFAT